MRILMVAHTDAPWTPLYAKHFLAEGHPVFVASFATATLEGVPHQFIGHINRAGGMSKWAYFFRKSQLSQLIRRFEPDLVFAPYLSSNGLAACVSWSGPLVVSAVGSDVLRPGHRSWLAGAVHSRVVRHVCRRADFIHVVSENLEHALRGFADPKKILRFPIGVRIDEFKPDPAMPRPMSRRLICIRRHEPIYDNATILQSLGKLEQSGVDFECDFVGGGSLLDAHRQLAVDLGLEARVRFLDQAPYASIPGLMRQSDLYISASLSDGASSSLLEAMACGLFPIVSDIEANHPWVRDGETGLLFPPRNVESLSRAIMNAMERFSLRESALGKNRARIESEGDFEENMKKIMSIFTRAIEAEGHPDVPH